MVPSTYSHTEDGSKTRCCAATALPLTPSIGNPLQYAGDSRVVELITQPCSVGLGLSKFLITVTVMLGFSSSTSVRTIGAATAITERFG